MYICRLSRVNTTVFHFYKRLIWFGERRKVYENSGEPHASTKAQVHFENTVINDVLLSDIKGFLSLEDQAILQNSCPDGRLKVWGITANRQQKQWEKLSVGDRVLF